MRDANLDTGPRFVRQWAEKASAEEISDLDPAIARLLPGAGAAKYPPRGAPREGIRGGKPSPMDWFYS